MRPSRPPRGLRPLVRRAGLLALLLLLGTVDVRTGQAAEGDAEERAELVALQVERGWKAFEVGSYDEVLARMKRLADLEPQNPLAPYLSARVHERRGAYEEALALAARLEAERPEDRAAQALRFRVLFALGRVEEAEQLAHAALGRRAEDLIARTVLGRAAEERGRRVEALAAYDAVLAGYQKAAPENDELPYVAHALLRATWLSPNPADDLLPQALTLLAQRVEAEPKNLDLLLQYASVWLEDRGTKGQATANRYFRQALKANEELAEARVGVARVALVFYQQDQALRQLERALETNPNLVPALRLLAAVHVGNGDYEKADRMLARALAVNPRDKETRAVKAARLFITGDTAGYEALAREVLAFDPTYGRFYLTVSDLVGERQRRYDVAATLAQKAIELDPSDALAHVTLGEAWMNLGRTEEARAAFTTAVARSKRYSDVKRDNWLEALDWMKGFVRQDTPRLQVRMAPREAEVLGPYLLPLLEEAWDTLSRKYGLDLQGPVHVDAFHRMDDFSVRSVGVPGLPALGVCFGKVITLLGPTSRPLGSFSWSRTAWHEFAHVVTLGVSQGQVPRWLTEGLSVYEEQARRPRWGRDMDRELFDRWSNDRLLRMEAINAAFRGPDILFAYYQGGLIAEHLTATRGFEVIPRMLRRFAEDKTTAEVFREVLGIELKDYDAAFREFVGRRVGGYKLVPGIDEDTLDALTRRVKEEPSDVTAWVRLGWGHAQRGGAVDAGARLAKAKALAPDRPDVLLLEAHLAASAGRADSALALYERFLAAGGDDLRARLVLAARLLKEGRDSEAAVRHLEAAKACFPRYIEKDSPYIQLARLHRGAGRMEQAVAEMEAYAAIAAEDVPVRKELLAWYREKRDHAAVARLCEEIIDVSPWGADLKDGPDLTLHRLYAETLAALGRADEALRERRVQVALIAALPEEQRIAGGEVDDRLLLGRLLLERGDREGAQAQAAAALRLVPGHVGARMLQQQASGAGGG